MAVSGVLQWHRLLTEVVAGAMLFAITLLVSSTSSRGVFVYSSWLLVEERVDELNDRYLD